MTHGVLSSSAEIIAAIRAGEMVILIDEEDRENEGDLVMAAEHATAEVINFMVKHGRGLVCLTLTEERCRQLELDLMVRRNGTVFGTAFTASIEAASGVTTGISAHDRARTIAAAVARHAKPSDIVQPGHIFPLRAQKGGVLIRAGHTEAGCDLAQLAGLEPAAVICEILKDDGSMARLPDLVNFAEQHKLKIGAIRDLIEYRSANESLVELVDSKAVSNRFGEFELSAFRDLTSGEIHLSLSCGKIDSAKETLVRVHSSVSILDWIDPQGIGHRYPINAVLDEMARHGTGVLIMLYRPQHSEELLKAFSIEHDSHELPKWDPRLFGVSAQILRALKVGKMAVISNPLKIPNMSGFGLEITRFVSLGKATPE